MEFMYTRMNFRMNYMHRQFLFVIAAVILLVIGLIVLNWKLSYLGAKYEERESAFRFLRDMKECYEILSTDQNFLNDMYYDELTGLQANTNCSSHCILLLQSVDNQDTNVHKGNMRYDVLDKLWNYFDKCFLVSNANPCFKATSMIQCILKKNGKNLNY